MDVYEVFFRHLDQLRRQFRAFESTVFVVAPECNMGRDSTYLAQAVERHRDGTPMHHRRIMILDDDDTNRGIRTDGKNPLMSKENLKDMAAKTIKGRQLRFHTKLVSVCDIERGVTSDKLIDRLVDQLQRYGADVIQPSRPDRSPTLAWNGKRGGQHDDLAMALQFLLVANRMVTKSPGQYGVRRPLV